MPIADKAEVALCERLNTEAAELMHSVRMGADAAPFQAFFVSAA